MGSSESKVPVNAMRQEDITTPQDAKSAFEEDFVPWQHLGLQLRMLSEIISCPEEQ